MERFIKDPEKVEKVREIFTGLYSLDFDEFGEQAVKMAMENAERQSIFICGHVLKNVHVLKYVVSLLDLC